MDELQFIIPDLDTYAIRKYLEQHVKHALDTLADPDISITDEISKLELERLNAAVGNLETLEALYRTWQHYRQLIRNSILYILEDMEKFDKEPDNAE